MDAEIALREVCTKFNIQLGLDDYNHEEDELDAEMRELKWKIAAAEKKEEERAKAAEERRRRREARQRKRRAGGCDDGDAASEAFEFAQEDSNLELGEDSVVSKQSSAEPAAARERRAQKGSTMKGTGTDTNEDEDEDEEDDRGMHLLDGIVDSIEQRY